MAYSANYSYFLSLFFKKDEPLCTAGENIIATTKIRNNYVAIQSSNVAIAILDFTSCKVITLNPFCILFGISYLLLF